MDFHLNAAFLGRLGDFEVFSLSTSQFVYQLRRRSAYFMEIMLGSQATVWYLPRQGKDSFVASSVSASYLTALRRENAVYVRSSNHRANLPNKDMRVDIVESPFSSSCMCSSYSPHIYVILSYLFISLLDSVT
jgi:hypothetical protein